MPTKSQWLLRVPKIRDELSAVTVPVLDRSVFERVFGVRRRRAIQLMHSFGGDQAGRTFLIDRNALLRKLDEIQRSDEFEMECRRKERLSAEVNGLRMSASARSVMIPVQREVYQGTLADLPEGVRLEPGQL